MGIEICKGIVIFTLLPCAIAARAMILVLLVTSLSATTIQQRPGSSGLQVTEDPPVRQERRDSSIQQENR